MHIRGGAVDVTALHISFETVMLTENEQQGLYHTHTLQ
jgi:hypothetical protein